jgi:arsenate reductase
MPDPADVEGLPADQRAAFRDAFVVISRRIDLLLSLPLEKLDRMAIEARLRAIGGGESGAA